MSVSREGGSRLNHSLSVRGILEACLYAEDLEAAERFYTRVIGLRVHSRVPGRHVFFRCGQSVFLVFNPERTSSESGQVGGASIPAHGARGHGHVAFNIPETDLDAWRDRLKALGAAIESEVAWPNGGRSLYMRDPAGNSVELATPATWGLVAEHGMDSDDTAVTRG